MDPITHAIVGLAVGCKAGGPLSLSNGLVVASALGAVMPDIDIVAYLRGEFAYLRQHRGFSHSIPGLALIALSLGLVLDMVYPAYSFTALVIWAFWGALSHTFLDLFNSYGVKILWPFNRRMCTLNLLTLFDPILFGMMLLSIVYGRGTDFDMLLTMMPPFYILIRLLMRLVARGRVRRKLQNNGSKLDIITFPAMRNPFAWDFVVNISRERLVGSIDIITGRFKIICSLKCITDEMKNIILGTNLGKLFSEFTPLYHIDCRNEEDKWIGSLMDLRYFVKDRFLHNGMLIMDREMKVEKQLFQPFVTSKGIDLS